MGKGVILKQKRCLIWVGFVLGQLFLGCSSPPQTVRSSSNSGAADQNQASTNPVSSEDAQAKAQAKLFFNDEVKRAFRNASSPRCLDCHNAPREVLGNPDSSDEAIYDYAKMFELLKEGGFAIDNGVINPMLGNSSHPGERICEGADDELCALVVKWWNLEFGAADDVAVKLGEIGSVSFSGSVSGYAYDANNTSRKFTVKVYIGGDSESGVLIGEQLADKSTQVNGLLQPYGFRINVPAASIQNDQQHEIYAYAVVGDKLQMLAGSPFTSKLYTPKGMAVSGNFYPAAAESCGGNCHIWNYQTLYGALASPDPLSGGSATNNRLYNKASGREAHGGPNVNLNTNALMSWWSCEFRNNCD